MSYKKVDPKVSFPKMEEEILAYWEANRIFEKSVAKDAPMGDFIFYEGPPTANGKPGLHHVLGRSLKDVFPRYKTMKGYRVARKAGWDTHGLPVELQVEKSLGLKNKQEIENIVPGDSRASIIEFNKRCKDSVWEYRDLWEKMTRRMGYWVDMEHPYVTYENRYIESVWWQLARIAELKDAKGESLLYRGHKVVPYCYRCGTALSSHEVAQGYQTVKDDSVYVELQLTDSNEQLTDNKKTSFVAWTTTPWTLPGNVALAVNPEMIYALIEKQDEGTGPLVRFILAQNRLEVVFGKDGYSVLKTISGKELVGMKYQPLFDTAGNDKEKCYKVIAGEFVTTDSGTGIVHIAPAFGEDDANVARENGLPTLHTVDLEGKVSVDVPGKGIPVKKKNDKNRYMVDDLIIDDLKMRGLLFKEEVYEHEYPFCWRCDTPLIYYAKPSWFIAMSAVREELVKNAEAITWVPENIKEGRFGEWLRGIKDWAISRDRYWGTPIPIWVCEKCGRYVVVESVEQLSLLSGDVLDDLHKPYIDDVQWDCECGKGIMIRTPEVMDVWFDSGAMPLAQFSYPAGSTAEEKTAIETGAAFPAGFISEAIDQTRGWFYTLHAVATLLHKAGAVPKGNAYDNVICHGHVLDGKGKKMSKSKGNVVDPFQMFNTYGADMLRWAMLSMNQPGLPKRFDDKVMRDVQNRVFRMLWNSYSFFMTYASIDDWNPSLEKNGEYKAAVSANYFDRWILAEIHGLINSVGEKLDTYDVYNASKDIEQFIDNLSNWYIRLNRNRFWKNENDNDKEDAYTTLHQVLVMLAKIMAPFTPFLSEEIFRNLTGKESVHLAAYPQRSTISFVDDGELLMILMRITRVAVSSGLQQRSQNGIKVRQPLANARVKFPELERYKDEKKELYNEFLGIFQRELNVKNVILERDIEQDIALDINITPELKLEGQAREIIRAVQEGRKSAGFNVEDRISLGYAGMADVFADEELKKLIAGETLAEGGVTEGELESADHTETVTIDDKAFTFWIKKI